MASNYYTFSGCDRDGWMLNVYNIVDYKYGVGDTISPKWNKSKVFDTLEECLELLNSLREEEKNVAI